MMLRSLRPLFYGFLLLCVLGLSLDDGFSLRVAATESGSGVAEIINKFAKRGYTAPPTPPSYDTTKKYTTAPYETTKPTTAAYETTKKYTTAPYETTEKHTTEKHTTAPYETTKEYTTAPYETTKKYTTAPYETTKKYTTAPYETTKKYTTAPYETTKPTTAAYETTKKYTTAPYETTEKHTTEKHTTAPYETTKKHTTEKHTTEKHTTAPYETTKKYTTAPHETTKKYTTAPHETTKKYTTNSYDTTEKHTTNSYDTTRAHYTTKKSTTSNYGANGSINLTVTDLNPGAFGPVCQNGVWGLFGITLKVELSLGLFGGQVYHTAPLRTLLTNADGQEVFINTAFYFNNEAKSFTASQIFNVANSHVDGNVWSFQLEDWQSNIGGNFVFDGQTCDWQSPKPTIKVAFSTDGQFVVGQGSQFGNIPPISAFPTVLNEVEPQFIASQQH